jgi:hypothetical protein
VGEKTEWGKQIAKDAAEDAVEAMSDAREAQTDKVATQVAEKISANAKAGLASLLTILGMGGGYTVLSPTPVTEPRYAERPHWADTTFDQVAETYRDMDDVHGWLSREGGDGKKLIYGEGDLGKKLDAVTKILHANQDLLHAILAELKGIRRSGALTREGDAHAQAFLGEPTVSIRRASHRGSLSPIFGPRLPGG